MWFLIHVKRSSTFSGIWKNLEVSPDSYAHWLQAPEVAVRAGRDFNGSQLATLSGEKRKPGFFAVVSEVPDFYDFLAVLIFAYLNFQAVNCIGQAHHIGRKVMIKAHLDLPIPFKVGCCVGKVVAMVVSRRKIKI